ncbi:MoaD/ThiS family protein [Sedimentibacter sp.]|uniref:MoaD/ThiS family protein n=1 Tax=Sedimentibacter sp. TaxID=1960295 RepID=UPI0028AAB268|nr:MoaD/ThiS family protein [Sedimentibacter sp.]
MEVEIRLFASFRKGRWKCKRLTYDNGDKITNILNSLNINKDEIGMILVNGEYRNSEYILSDGDILSIFPPVAGG